MGLSDWTGERTEEGPPNQCFEARVAVITGRPLLIHPLARKIQNNA